MHILNVTPFYVPIIGGVETVVYETCMGLARMGLFPTVLTSEVPNCPGREVKDGVEVIRTPQLNVPESGVVSPSSYDTIHTAEFFANIVRNLNIDIVHLHNYHMSQYAMFLFSFFKAIDEKQQMFITVHNNTDDKFSHYLLSCLPFSKVIALTYKSAFDLIKGGVPESKIEVVPNMLEVDKFSKADGRPIRKLLGVEEDPIVLFPSRLVGREKNPFLEIESGKGLDILLKALPLVKREIPNVRLLLMGNDPIYQDIVLQVRRKILRMARVFGVEENILFFNGQLPQHKIPEVFAASDVVVSLGPTECFGMVFLEGMAAGKPVIGVNSNLNGVPKVVCDGKTGFLVPPKDPWSTAKTLLKVISNREFSVKIGSNGQNWVRERFDTTRVLPRLLEIYEKSKNTFMSHVSFSTQTQTPVISS